MKARFGGVRFGCCSCSERLVSRISANPARIGVRTFAIDEATASAIGVMIFGRISTTRSAQGTISRASVHAYTATATDGCNKISFNQLGLSNPEYCWRFLIGRT